MKKIAMVALSLFALLVTTPEELKAAKKLDLVTDDIERVSVVDGTGSEADGSSTHVSVSADGRYVVFESKASNLVTGDTNGLQDVFIHDRGTGLTERVSVDSNEAQANSVSYDPVVSADGRYISFHSLANNLVSGDTNNRVDVFLRDRTAGTTIRVSVDSSGTQADGNSVYSSISDDGNLIAFMSEATNLVGDDTNDVADIFVHNVALGTTTRVSVDSAGVEGDGESYEAMISGNGEFVVFASKATNLVDGDNNGCSDVFVHGLDLGTVVVASVHSNGTLSNGLSDHPRISADGLSVVFSSKANNLVDSDINSYQDIFFHSLQVGGGTELVSVDSAGQQISMPSSHPSISGSGRFITFSSLSPGVVAGDGNGSHDIFMYDRGTQSITLVSSDSSQVIGNGESKNADMSDDGRYVVFESSATNLVANDLNGKTDIFHKENEVALPNVGVTVANLSLDEEVDANVDFTFTRSGDTSLALTVNISSSEGTASTGSDFVAPADTVFFPIGEDTVVVNVSLLNDSDLEVRESLKLSVQPGAEYVSVAPTNEAVSLITSGEKPSISIRTSKVFYEVGGPRLTQAWVEIFRETGDSINDLVVPLSIIGTAENGVDYETLPEEVVIPVGQSSVRFTVQSINDEENEGIESIIFDLTSNLDYVVGNKAWNALYLMDNDQCANLVNVHLLVCDFVESFKRGHLSNQEFEEYFELKKMN